MSSDSSLDLLFDHLYIMPKRTSSSSSEKTSSCENYKMLSPKKSKTNIDTSIEDITDIDGNELSFPEIFRKYENISRTTLESFCERAMIFNKAGANVPEMQENLFKYLGKNQSTTHPLIPNEKESKKTTFGEGRVGVSCESYGIKKCFCCNKIQQNFTCLSNTFQDLDATPSCSAGANNIITVADDNYSLLTPTSVNDVKPKKIYTDDEIMNYVDLINADMDLDEERKKIKDYDLELSNCMIKNENQPRVSKKVRFNLVAEVMSTSNNAPSTSDCVINNSDVTIIDLSANNTPTVRDSSNSDFIEIIDDSPLINHQRNVPEIINLDDYDLDSSVKLIDEVITVNSDTPKHKGLGECSVCLEDLQNKEIMSTICGHIFCAPCIKSVIKITKKCPNCRKSLNLKRIHPLFI